MREGETEIKWVGVRYKDREKKLPKSHGGREERCLQGSSIFFITMQRYRSSTVIKVSLTVVLRAVYRYSTRARQSRRNLEDKVKDNHEHGQNIKRLFRFIK